MESRRDSICIQLKLTRRWLLFSKVDVQDSMANKYVVNRDYQYYLLKNGERIFWTDTDGKYLKNEPVRITFKRDTSEYLFSGGLKLVLNKRNGRWGYRKMSISTPSNQVIAQITVNTRSLGLKESRQLEIYSKDDNAVDASLFVLMHDFNYDQEYVGT